MTSSYCKTSVQRPKARSLEKKSVATLAQQSLAARRQPSAPSRAQLLVDNVGWDLRPTGAQVGRCPSLKSATFNC